MPRDRALGALIASATIAEHDAQSVLKLAACVATIGVGKVEARGGADHGGRRDARAELRVWIARLPAA